MLTIACSLPPSSRTASFISCHLYVIARSYRTTSTHSLWSFSKQDIERWWGDPKIDDGVNSWILRQASSTVPPASGPTHWLMMGSIREYCAKFHRPSSFMAHSKLIEGFDDLYRAVCGHYWWMDWSRFVDSQMAKVIQNQVMSCRIRSCHTHVVCTAMKGSVSSLWHSSATIWAVCQSHSPYPIHTK